MRLKYSLVSLLRVLTLAILPACFNLSYAELPGTVMPGQIEKQFQPLPHPQAEQSGGIIVPEPGQAPPANAADIRFTLNKLIVDSVSVYAEGELLPLYQDMQGKQVTLADIYKIASRLTSKYRNDGYILSRVIVPAQSVEQGIVHLKAVEGYVAQIHYTGERRDTRALVERYTAPILHTKPLTAAVLERAMLLVNDLPGVFASATIKASETQTAAADLVINFSQKIVHGGLSLDNRGGRALGPGRLSGDIGFNSLLGMQDFTSLRFVTSANGEIAYYSLMHEQLIGGNGGKLTLSYSDVRSTPEEMTFIPLNLETTSKSTALTYSYPLIRSRTQNLRLRGSLTSHDGETELFGITDTRDRIRALRAGATFDLVDSMRGVNILDVEFSHGLKGLGASDNHDPMLSRTEGRVDFSKLSLYAARLQDLAPRWSLLAALNAQYAFNDLLSSELYSFGGEQFGRGYDPSELVGDHGAALKLEMRYNGVLPSLGASYTGYAFYDVGKVYQRSPGGLSSSESAAAAGVGMRMSLGTQTTGYVELAKPLTREVAAEGNRDIRGYAGISWRF